MKIRVGYELIYDFPQPTPMIMVLGTHFTRASDIVVPDHLMTSPSVPISPYRDVFGNWCSRIIAPAGRIRLWADGVVNDTRRPDSAAPWVAQHAVEDLPAETLNFLLAVVTARPTGYPKWPGTFSVRRPWDGGACRRFAISFIATSFLGTSMRVRPRPPGMSSMKPRASVATTTHLAVTFCRCMNIPARYCTGYLGDIGMPPPYGPMDFAGWFEAYLGGRWYTFDA